MIKSYVEGICRHKRSIRRRSYTQLGYDFYCYICKKSVECIKEVRNKTCYIDSNICNGNLIYNKNLEKEDLIMLRQAISISLKDLKKLEEEIIGTLSSIPGITFDMNKKVQFNIINKEPECSDTWEFE